MGYLKERQLEQQAQGWSFTDQRVCTGCVDDYALQAAISAAADPEQTCAFCRGGPAAELDVLLGIFVKGLRTEYGDADDEGVFYDGHEGGYQFVTSSWDSTWELVHDQFSDVLVGEGLADAVSEAMDEHAWVEVDFISPRRDEALLFSWEQFCDEMKYGIRYVFWLRGDQDATERGAGEVPAGLILDHLGRLTEDLGLLRTLPAGTRVWRAREHAELGGAWGATDLGTALPDQAREANRMSPAGIPLFYGAEDADTALQEVAARSEYPWVTVGAFETSRPCIVVDFSRLPAIPSMFDMERGRDRRPLLFLHKLVTQLSKPAREKYEQIDYVPTQIVTEYLLRISGKGHVAGLQYRSALTGETCVALDVPQHCCIEQGEAMDNDVLRLELVRGSLETRRIG